MRRIQFDSTDDILEREQQLFFNIWIVNHVGFNSILSCKLVVDSQINTSRNVGIFASWKEASL